MKRRAILVALGSLVGCGGEPAAAPRGPVVEAEYRPMKPASAPSGLLPGLAPKDPGASLEDPYPYLGEAGDARTIAWVADQTRFTERVLAPLPREEIARELSALPTMRNYGQILVRPEATIVSWFDGRLHVAVTPRGKAPRELDVGKLQALASLSASASGKRFAVTAIAELAHPTTLIFDSEGAALETLPDVDAPKWSHAGDAVYYRHGRRDVAPVIRRHLVGEPPSADRTVFGNGAAGELLVRDWTAETSLTFEVGKRALVVVIRRKHLPVPGSPPAFVAVTVPIDGRPMVASTRSLPTQLGLVAPESDDDVLLYTWEHKKLALARSAAEPGGATLRLASDAEGYKHAYEAADAIYVRSEKLDEVVRLSKRGGLPATIALPGRIVQVESAPEQPGLRVHLASPTRGGWFEIDAKGTVARMAFAVPQTQALDDVREVSIPLGTDPATVVTIVAAKTTSETSGGPAIVLPGPQDVPRPQLLPFLARGGIVVHCPTGPSVGGVSAFQQCLLAFDRSAWKRPYGVLADDFRGYAVRDALATEARAVVVRRAFLPLVKEGSRPEMAVLAPSLGATMRLPLLAFPGDHPQMRTLTNKLVATLNERSSDEVTAFLAPSKPSSPEVEREEMAEAEAFFLWALAGVAKDKVPSFKRP